MSVLPSKPPAEADGATPDGGVAIHTAGAMPQVPTPDALYAPLNREPAPSGVPVTLTAIPYYAWGNRGMQSMRVWIPEAI